MIVYLTSGVEGGKLEQIEFLLGHGSVQTTERYVGCNQRISCAVNDSHGDRTKTLGGHLWEEWPATQT